MQRNLEEDEDRMLLSATAVGSKIMAKKNERKIIFNIDV